MTLFVVPGERHVERMAREGIHAETRTSLRTRLVAALLPDVRFADPRETRLALAMALWPEEAFASASPARQLDLFGTAKRADPVLAPLRRRGGTSWVRLVESIDAAIGVVRARGATAEDLERVATRAGGVTASRAGALAVAMRALDRVLAKSGARDGRLLGRALVEAIATTAPTALAAHVGDHRVRARWLLAWDQGDLAWWRALDERLAAANGWARVALPSFDRPLEGSRERDPLETLAEDLASGLDAAPEAEPIAMVLGDLAGTGPKPEELARVRIVRAQDPVAQARAVTALVSEALAGGAAVERVVIAAPSLDERTLAPVRRAIEDAGIVAYEARGTPPSEAPVVFAALLALEAAATLDRRTVARLLRSGFVDPAAIVGGERREAERSIARVAQAFETKRMAAGPDPAARLVATVPADDAAAARALVDILRNAHAPRMRADHVRSARGLWSALGIGARAGRGGLATFASDESPSGVPRAERLAIARDARAWESLANALDAYESVAHASDALEHEIDGEVFRLELVGVLDAAAMRPGAGRAGAVRITRLADVAGDELDLLVVIDANEGVLPRDVTQDAIVSDALGEALARASRGSFAPLSSSLVRARELSALATAAADAARVVLSFTVEDGAGAPLAPSPVVDVLVRAGAVVSAPPGSVAVAPAAGPIASADDVMRRASRERTREAFFLDPRRPTSDLVADLGARPSAEVRAILEAETGGGARSLSVTGLERFARCPFMGYAHVILAAREAERQEELPDAREEGNLIHEALAAAFVATQEQWARRPRDRAAIFQRGLAAADEVLARAAGHAALAAVVRLRVRDAVVVVLSRACDDDVWDFALAEQVFGSARDASWPALELEDGGVRLSLRGTIDRVDRAHDGQSVRVIDYKRSKSTVDGSSRGLGETALQVPLYACVASRRFGVPGKGLYLPTQPRDLATGAVPSAKVERRMDDLVAREAPGALTEIERRALGVVRAVREGRLAPTPADESACRTCAVSGGCRKPRFAMAPADEEEEGAS